MGDPITMVIAGLAAGGTQAFGSWYSGQAQKNMYNYQAGVAQANAKIFEQNKNMAYDVGERQARISGQQNAQIVGQQRADAGAGNLNPSAGSSAQVQASQISAGRQTQQNVRYNAAQSAYGETVKQFSAEAEAKILPIAGRTAMAAGEIGAASSVLGGISSVSSKWTQAKETTPPSSTTYAAS
jgi:hypothetical protein